jgi:hypothetical protein
VFVIFAQEKGKEVSIVPINTNTRQEFPCGSNENDEKGFVL